MKSLDNIPAEIRDKFNPMFASELSKIVRVKSQRRELLGFADPVAEKSSEVNDSELIEQLSQSFQSATLDRPKSLPRDLNRRTKQINPATSERALNSISAHEALFGSRPKSREDQSH